MPLMYQSQASNTTTASSYSFTGMAIGTASSDRYIIASVVGRKGGTGMSITSVTIGGISATLLKSGTVEVDGNSQPVALYMALVPTGTTATVAVTFSDNALRASAAVWSLTGMTNPTVYASNDAGAVAQQVDASVSAPNNSYVISAGMQGANASNPRWNVGQTVQSFGVQYQTNGYHTGSTLEVTTAQSVSAIFRTDNSAIKNIVTVALYTPSGGVKINGAVKPVKINGAVKPLKRYNGTTWQ